MIEYEEEFLITLIFRYDGGVMIRAAMFAIPAAVFAVMMLYMDDWYPGMRDWLSLHQLAHSTVWNASVSVLSILLGFRTGQAFSRFWEGTGLLHQMRGEWFDTVSNCVTFSISARKIKPREVMKFRHTMVRLMSLCHGSALEEIASNSIKVEAIDVFGLDEATLSHLRECHDEFGFNKVEVMLHLVQSLITSSHDAGILKIPPPILSRVYQTISRGFVNLLNAKKITDTRFPFPYAQLIAILLFIHTVLTPIIITGTIRSKVLAALISFVATYGMFAVNFIASELENPFGTDDNDLPLHHFQEEMNRCLLMLLHNNTDMISGVNSERCMLSFEGLMESMAKHDEDGSDNGAEPRKCAGRLSSFSELIEEELQKQEEEQKQKELDDAQAPPQKVEPVEWADGAAGAQPEVIEARLASLHPRFSNSLDEFLGILHGWTGSLEGQVMQLHETFAALRAVNSLRGWEAAVHPSP